MWQWLLVVALGAGLFVLEWYRAAPGMLAERLKRENARMREALLWYADRSHWRRRHYRGRHWNNPPALIDRGARAARALEDPEGSTGPGGEP